MPSKTAANSLQRSARCSYSMYGLANKKSGLLRGGPVEADVQDAVIEDGVTRLPSINRENPIRPDLIQMGHYSHRSVDRSVSGA
jgi:hypothetical protein